MKIWSGYYGKGSPTNPDPKKYAIRKRGDKFILVPVELIRWRKRRKQAQALEKLKNEVLQDSPSEEEMLKLLKFFE